MTSFGKTSIVYNNPSKLLGLPPYYYRLRSCDTNLTNDTPANQYQRLKLIQNTVRVSSSIYTSNLGPLNAYKQPTAATYGVCWNQMSDRPVPSVQRATIPTGFYNNLNSRHHSVTSSKPGSQTPGGAGCDIKHNSYDRYLNRLKGKGPLRRGPISPTFGAPIPFNPAFPVYGGKTTKTNIVNGCDCPIIQTPDQKLKQDIRIYNNPLYQADPTSTYAFSEGQYVYAIEPGTDYYSKALVTDVDGDTYTIKFTDGTIDVQNINQLLIYFPCNCESFPSTDFTLYSTEFINYIKSKYPNFCNIAGLLTKIQQQY
jgi:hypothetical protein